MELKGCVMLPAVLRCAFGCESTEPVPLAQMNIAYLQRALGFHLPVGNPAIEKVQFPILTGKGACVRPPGTKGSCHCCLTRQEFLANNPSLTEIRSEILHYATFEQEIDELKPIIVVGALELHTGNVNSVTGRSQG